MSDLCRLGLRFVHSNLEAFNLVLLGPMTLIDHRLDPQTVDRESSGGFFFHGPPAYQSEIWREEEHWTFCVIPFAAVVLFVH